MGTKKAIGNFWIVAAIWLLGLLSTLARADELNLVVDNIRPVEGNLMIQVLDSEPAFDAETAVPTVAIIQRVDSSSLTFSMDLPAGDYAIRIFHDVNHNGKLDENFIGMPKEPIGFSNNASYNFGPPGWSESKFELSGPTQQKIRMSDS